MSGGRYIYLIRHAEPETDGVPRYLGRTDLPLSGPGRKHAAQMGEILRGKAVDHVFCSPLNRCVDTAGYVAPNPIVVPGLEEVDMGEWENAPRESIRARFPALYERRGADLADFCPPGGESFRMCADRAWKAFRAALSAYGGNVAVVGHAGVNRALLCCITGWELRSLMRFKQSYCGITTLYEDDMGIVPIEME